MKMQKATRSKRSKTTAKQKGIKKEQKPVLDQVKPSESIFSMKDSAKSIPQKSKRRSHKKQKKSTSPQVGSEKGLVEKVKTKSKSKLASKYRTHSILQELEKYKFQRLPENKCKVAMHSTYEIDSSNPIYENIEELFMMFYAKQKRKAEEVFLKTRYTYFPTFQFYLAGEKPSDNKCCICQFEFEELTEMKEHKEQLTNLSGEDIVALRCSHLLHENCLKMLIGDKEWFKCPVCSMIYGKMIGDQPPGKMTTTTHEDMHCDGYPDVGTIVIHYSMHSGKRGDISFPGTGRTAYLPNNIEGNEVLSLLQEAFNRKLIFTIGRSVTTGRDNQIVWNGIHHKTNTSGGSSHFGYPDDTYFDRVKLELAAKGIF